MVDQRSWVHMLSVISRSCVWEIYIWVLPALLQRLKGWGVSLSVLRPYAAHCITLVCMARRKEADLFSKHLFCCFRFDKRVWRQPGEEYKDKCVFPTVKHGGGSVMVWDCMSAAGTGELLFIEGTMNANMYCDILKQSMIPSLRRLGHWAVFQHDNYAKHTSKSSTALLKKLRVKVICGASSNGRWRSARSLTSTSSVMSSWRSGRGLQWQPVKLWWTPRPRGLRHCWKILVATQYWHFGPNLDIST